MIFEYVKDGSQDMLGYPVPAYGIYHGDVFICDPFISECGRFRCDPLHYGLSVEDANKLVSLNRQLGLTMST